MTDRIHAEIEILKEYFDEVLFQEQEWLMIRNYPIPSDLAWNMNELDVCFQVPSNYPGQAPYGIYVPSNLRFNGSLPAKNYQKVAKNQPPFDGSWGMISWTIDGKWIPKEDIRTGANLLSFVMSFADRFKMGVV